MERLAIRVQRRDVVSAQDRRSMVDFALTVTPGLDERYIARRLESYPRVASAWRGERLLAFQLVDERASPDLTLVYLGPAFSKVGAYVVIFASLVSERVDAGASFCIAAEFESEAAERTLRRLLPRSAFPGAAGEGPSGTVRALAARFARSFDHIVDLDEERLWTRMVEPMKPSAASRAHYQMMVMPCLSGEERARLLEDLSAGLESFRSRGAGSHRAAPRRAAPRRAAP